MSWPWELSAFVKLARAGAICLLPTRNGQYLMQDDAFGTDYKPKLRPPGGGKEPEDKSLLDTIVRELGEEFGLEEEKVRKKIKFMGYTPQKKYWGTPVFQLKGHGLKPKVYQASNHADEKIKLVEVSPDHPNYTGPQPHKLITEESLKLGDKMRKAADQTQITIKDEVLPGGKADEAGKKPEDFPARSMAKGMDEEKEHSKNKTLQKAIVADHLTEDPKYYAKAASIAVDLDGTLAHKDPGPFDPQDIGEPIPAMMEKVKAWLADGKEVVIFTARAADAKNVPPVKAWLKKHGLEACKVTNRKTPDMEEFHDDRAVAIVRNTGEEKLAAEKDTNPYNEKPCPICGEFSDMRCKCSGPHTLEMLKNGHGTICPNGHRWSGDLVYDPTVKPTGKGIPQSEILKYSETEKSARYFNSADLEEYGKKAKGKMLRVYMHDPGANTTDSLCTGLQDDETPEQGAIRTVEFDKKLTVDEAAIERMPADEDGWLRVRVLLPTKTEQIKKAAQGASALFTQLLGGKGIIAGQQHSQQAAQAQQTAGTKALEWEQRKQLQTGEAKQAASLFTVDECVARARHAYTEATGDEDATHEKVEAWCNEGMPEQEKEAKFQQPENFETIERLSIKGIRIAAGANDWEQCWTWATANGGDDRTQNRVWIQLDPPQELVDGSKFSDWGEGVIKRWIAAAKELAKKRAEDLEVSNSDVRLDDLERAADGLEGVKTFGREETTWREKHAAAMSPDASVETMLTAPTTGPEAIAWALQNVDLTKKEAEAKAIIARKLKSKRPDAVKLLGFIEGFKRSGLSPSDLILDKVPVIPPQFRPYTVAGNVFVPGDANELYRDLINLKDMHGELEAKLGPRGAAFNKLNVYDATKALYGYGVPTSPKTRERGVSGFLKKVVGANPKFCYDDATEILTENGWMWLREFNGQCRVLSVDPQNHITEYAKVEHILHQTYSGRMLRIAPRNRLDLLVTPEHRLLVNVRRGNSNTAKRDMSPEKWEIVTAENFAQMGERRWMRIAANDFKGSQELPPFMIGVSPSVFAFFVGLWAAEGWSHQDRHAAMICQKEGSKHVAKINEIIQLLGLRTTSKVYVHTTPQKIKVSMRWWTLNSKELVEWLSNHVGDGAHNKRFSRTIMGWDGAMLRSLLSGFLHGDGCKRTDWKFKGSKSTKPVSHEFRAWHSAVSCEPGILHDLGEIGIKIGVPIGEPTAQKAPNSKTGLQWRSHIMVNPFAPSEAKEGQEWVDYSGMIHCVTVAHGLIVVRRNGKPVISGNSFIQRRLMGRNLDYVGRGVIAPDPDLGLDEIGLPEDMAWKMYAPYVQRRLVRGGMRMEDAVKAIEDRTGHASKHLDLELKHRPVMYNRDPSWHRFNAIGGYVKRVPGSTIMINPLVTTGQSGDFDGDQIGVHLPSLDAAVDDVKEKLMPSKMLFSIKDPNKVVPAPKHEQILGLYSAQNTPARNKWNFASEPEALAAIKSGRVALSDEINIGGGMPKVAGAPEPDRFEEHRKQFGAEKVDGFLAKFGLGPKYVPKPAKKHACPKCGQGNATHKEIHPDTDMNEMVLSCPDCGHEESK